MHIYKDTTKQIVGIFYDTDEEYVEHKKEMMINGYSCDKKFEIPNSKQLQVVYSKTLNKEKSNFVSNKEQ